MKRRGGVLFLALLLAAAPVAASQFPQAERYFAVRDRSRVVTADPDTIARYPSEFCGKLVEIRGVISGQARRDDGSTFIIATPNGSVYLVEAGATAGTGIDLGHSVRALARVDVVLPKDGEPGGAQLWLVAAASEYETAEMEAGRRRSQLVIDLPALLPRAPRPTTERMLQTVRRARRPPRTRWMGQLGVMVAPSAIWSVPYSGARCIHEVPAGRYVMVTRKRSGWCAVRMRNGGEGWLPAPAVCLLDYDVVRRGEVEVSSRRPAVRPRRKPRRVAQAPRAVRKRVAAPATVTKRAPQPRAFRYNDSSAIIRERPLPKRGR